MDRSGFHDATDALVTNPTRSAGKRRAASEADGRLPARPRGAAPTGWANGSGRAPTKERSDPLAGLIVGACRMVAASGEVRSVTVVPGRRPTFRELVRARAEAQACRVRLVVAGDGTLTVRRPDGAPVRSVPAPPTDPRSSAPTPPIGAAAPTVAGGSGRHGA